MRAFPDISLRSVTAVVVLLGLLAVVAASFIWRSIDDTERFFTLTQGILLGAFGWLYGSQGTDRAEKVAADALAGQWNMTSKAESAEVRLERLERSAALTDRALGIALSVPGVREKVDEVLRQEGGEDP